MSKPHLLMMTTMLDELDIHADEHFEILRVKDLDDPAIDASAGSITAIAHGGHTLTVSRALLHRLPNVKIVANFGVGYDGVDTTAAAERGIIVTNTPNVLNEEVADTALGLLIMTARELGQAEQYLRSGQWGSKGDYPLTTTTLRDRAIGIVGLGRIGRAIAKRCEAFGLPISYFSRTEKPDSGYRFYADLVDMAGAVDTLIVITPGTPETKDLINADVLSALGPNGIVINVARGSVVDEPALMSALKSKTIAAAGLDVMVGEPNINPELMQLENCVLLPHVGSGSLHTRRAMGQLVVDNLIAFKEKAPPKTPVPETPFNGW